MISLALMVSENLYSSQSVKMGVFVQKIYDISKNKLHLRALPPWFSWLSACSIRSLGLTMLTRVRSPLDSMSLLIFVYLEDIFKF